MQAQYCFHTIGLITYPFSLKNFATKYEIILSAFHPPQPKQHEWDLYLGLALQRQKKLQQQSLVHFPWYVSRCVLNVTVLLPPIVDVTSCWVDLWYIQVAAAIDTMFF